MGVKNLWDILESCKKTLPLHHLQNKRVCIDLSCWMVQLQKVNKSYCAAKEKVYLRGLFHRLRALIALNCSLIFVTDGAIPAVKISTYRKRLNAAHEDAGDDAERDKISSLRRNKGSEFSCMIKEAKTLGRALGIPCLDGIEEAEAQCALLNSESICDGCFSSDSDVFLFGARTVYRDICLEKGGYVVCYEMGDIEHKLGLGRNSLIALALLLGSDYSHGVYGFGPESACQVIRSVGEDAILQRIASDGISFLKSLKTSKKHGQFPVNNGKENNPAPTGKATGNELLRVVDAYMKPKCHSADSDPVYRALAVHPFQRTELQQICAQFFEWPPEKTDEYILPRIAERDLRRFANLRSSSSQLGVALPLHEMPIKCSVAEVLNHRRVVGKECFEVSWENFDGLKTSIVPADLVESACPEKIEEFEERRAQKKQKNKPRPRKKSEDKASMANVDQKLQQLLLDIEAEDNVRSRNPLCSSTSVSGSSIVGSLFSSTSMSGSSSVVVSSCRSTFMSESSSVVDLTISDPFFGQYECNMTGMPIKDSHSGPPPSTSLSRSSDRDDSPCSSTSMSGSSSIVDLTMPDTFGSEDYKNDIAGMPTKVSHSDPSPTTMEMDVIDLLSSPPAPSTRFLSKCKGDTEPDYEPNMAGMLTKDGGSEAPQTSTMEMDVIDLLSPPQAPSTGFLSKCKGDVKPISVIDLSGSDVEMSPEHAQKSRELRLFLASIRAEIS